MIGRPGLDVDAASSRPPPGPAGHLRHELEGPLGRTEVREMEPGVRVDDPDHGHVGKIQPLRDHLRPEQDVDRSLLHALEHPMVRPLRARRVQIHAGDPRLGESETDEMLELLGPQAPHPLRLLAAQPADGGNNLLVTAVVAPQRSRCLMHREGDGAAGAGAHIAAGGTLQVRREAASVQEEDHLLAPSEGAAHGLVERHGPWYPAGVGYPLGAAQVDHRDRWQRSRADPVGQLETHHLPRGGEVQRLEGGRGAAQNHPRSLESRALDGHVAGMVARRRPLLVARLVLFVHHDRPEPLDGSEHRRAGPDGQASLAAPQRPPRVGALAVRQPRVQHRHLVAEHAAHPRDRLRRERDLGDEQDGTGTRRYDATKHVEIDERFSGARDALDQGGRLGRRPQDPGHDAALVGREVGGWWGRQAGERIPGARYVGVAGHTLGHEPVQRGGRQPEPGDQVADRRRAADRLQGLVRHATLGRAFERPLALEQRRQRRGQREHALHLLGRPRRPAHAPQRPREQRPQREPQGDAVVAADPDAERQQRWRDRRFRVGRGHHRLRHHRGCRRVDRRNYSHHLPSLNRHDDPGAGHDAGPELRRDLIRIRARDRDGEDDLGIASSDPRARARGQWSL